LSSVEPLSGPKERGLEALLACDTITEAATRARVGRRTLQRWLGEAAFASELSRRRSRVIDGALTVLARAAAAAAKVLHDVASDAEAPVYARLQAASTILATVGKFEELSALRVRIEELEAAMHAPATSEQLS